MDGVDIALKKLEEAGKLKEAERRRVLKFLRRSRLEKVVNNVQAISPTLVFYIVWAIVQLVKLYNDKSRTADG